ncbi:hypothetical protein Vretifemale_12841, partial [Volvox reticuliferus]
TTRTSSSRPSRWGIRQLMGLVSAGFASLRQHLGRMVEPASGNLRPEAVAELTRWTSRTDLVRAIAQVTDMEIVSQSASRSVVCRGRAGGAQVFIKYTAGPGRGEGMAAPATEGLLSRVLVHPNVVRTHGWHLTQVAAEDLSGDLEAALTAAAAAGDRRRRRQREQRQRPPPGPLERQLSQPNQQLNPPLPPRRQLTVLAEGPAYRKQNPQSGSLLLRSLRRKQLSCGDSATAASTAAAVATSGGNSVGFSGGQQICNARCRTSEFAAESLLYGTAVVIPPDEVLDGKPAGEDGGVAADSGHGSYKGYDSAPASIFLARTATAGSCPTAIQSLYNVHGSSGSGGDATNRRHLSIGTLPTELGSAAVGTPLLYNGTTLQAGSGNTKSVRPPCEISKPTGAATTSVDCGKTTVAVARINTEVAGGTPTAAAAAAPSPIPQLTWAQAAKAWREMQDMIHRLNARPGDYIARIVMEAADLGSLLTVIRQGVFSGSSASTLRLHALLLTARDVTRGMAHLHCHAILHGDLKPSNVLLRSDPTDPRGFVAVVSDFGLSRIAPLGCLEGSELYGTVSFMAPEVISGYRCPASDVYSYGVLLWQMINQTAPWPRLRNVQVMMGVLQGELRLSAPPDTYPPLATLVERCLTYSHATRPTFEVIERELESMLRDVEQILATSNAAVGTVAVAVVANQTGEPSAATASTSTAALAYAGMSPSWCPPPPITAEPSAAAVPSTVTAGLLSAMPWVAINTAKGKQPHPPWILRSTHPSRSPHPQPKHPLQQHHQQQPGHQQVLMIHRDVPSGGSISARALLAYTGTANPMYTGTTELEGDLESTAMGSTGTLNLRLDTPLSITTNNTYATTVALVADGIGDATGGGGELLEGRDVITTTAGIVTASYMTDVGNGTGGVSAQSGVGASRCRNTVVPQREATGRLTPISPMATGRILDTREWTLALTMVASGSGSVDGQAGSSMVLLTPFHQMQQKQPQCINNTIMSSSAGQHISTTTTTATAVRTSTRHYYYCSSNSGARAATPAASSTGGATAATPTESSTTFTNAGVGGSGGDTAADGGELATIKPNSHYFCRSSNKGANKPDSAASGTLMMSGGVCVGALYQSRLMAGSNACDNGVHIHDNSCCGGSRNSSNFVAGDTSAVEGPSGGAARDNDANSMSIAGGIHGNPGNGKNGNYDDTKIGRSTTNDGVEEEREMIKGEEQLYAITAGSNRPNPRRLSSVIAGNLEAAATKGHLSSSSATFGRQCSSWCASTTVTTTNTNNTNMCTTTQNTLINSIATSTPLLLGGSQSPLPSTSMAKCIPVPLDNVYHRDCAEPAAVPIIVPIRHA